MVCDLHVNTTKLDHSPRNKPLNSIGLTNIRFNKDGLTALGSDQLIRADVVLPVDVGTSILVEIGTDEVCSFVGVAQCYCAA